MTSGSLKKLITQGGFMIVFLLMVAACGEVVCPGGDRTGSCFRVDNIQPTYLSKENVPNVDVVASECGTGGTSTPATIEKFTGHFAQVNFSNRPVEGGAVPVNETSKITLRSFSIDYRVNHCPVGEECPLLDRFVAVSPNTVVISENSTASETYPFVDLAQKFEFVRKRLGLPSFNYFDFFPPSSAPPFPVERFLDFPSYTATYTFDGFDTFGNGVSASGSQEFTVGEYDNCSTT
ncbi:MAG: hypothetical protein AAB317_00610 [Nitrospirota bacterium]